VGQRSAVRRRYVYRCLGNDPRGSTTLKLGDEVRVPEELISDWKYIENDVLAGGYSLRLIRSRMTDKARHDLDPHFDFSVPE